MLKYAKIIDENTGLCEVGEGTNEKVYKALGMELLDVKKSDKDTGWYLADKCPMKTNKEIAQEKRNIRATELKCELEALDLAAVRPLRAIATGTATDEDSEKLCQLETQAGSLRAELAEIVLND